MTIATHLLQSTVCVAIATLLALALRRAPARTRYAVWLLASVKFLVPFSLLTAAGSYLGARTAATATPSVSVVVRWLDQSLSFWGFEEAAGASVAGLPVAVDRLVLLALAAVWASGAVGLAIWRVRQWRDVASLARALPRLAHGREADALRQVTQRSAHRPPIAILRSQASLEPGVLGVFHPRLLWPDGLSDRLTDVELEAVLAHEVCHVRRRDNLSALLHVVVETLFWFHPVVWWVGSRLVSERERACDEEVLQMGADNRSYAEGILKVCTFGFRSPAAFVAGVGGPRLTQRIEWILERRVALHLSLTTRLLIGVVVAVTAGTPIAAGALHARRGMMNAVAAAADSAPGIRAIPAAGTSSGPGQETPHVYRPGGDVKPPRLTKEVKPEYTPEAKEARIQGSVLLEAVVLDTGEVGEIEVTRSLDKDYGLDDEAVRVMRQWRFEPGTKDGRPVAVRVEVEMSFTLK